MSMQIVHLREAPIRVKARSLNPGDVYSYDGGLFLCIQTLNGLNSVRLQGENVYLLGYTAPDTFVTKESATLTIN